MWVAGIRIRPSDRNPLAGLVTKMASRDQTTGNFNELRRRIGASAAAIAMTEEWIAGTLDRLASNRPHEEARLKARADEARTIAARERGRAAEYGWDPPVTGSAAADGLLHAHDPAVVPDGQSPA